MTRFCILISVMITWGGIAPGLPAAPNTVRDHLLPAFHPDPLPENLAAEAKLGQALAGLKVRERLADGAASRAETASGVERVVPLWPGKAPGETKAMDPEHDTTKGNGNLVAGQRVMRIGNVSEPTISLFRPPADQDTGTAVVVCPGGGYNILAYDLEGTEICDWLNSIGITGVLLKYRVPARPGSDRHAAAAQDAQRALGLVRHHAAEWGIDPDRIGVLGFSAGGHLSAWLSNHQGERTYPRVDDADAVSCRPDFAVLVYPAYLTSKEQDDRIAPDLKLSPQTPPTFLVMAQDDPVRVENVLHYALALQDVRVRFELHVYPEGGHGYGLRSGGQDVISWPARAADWMRGLGVCGEREASQNK